MKKEEVSIVSVSTENVFTHESIKQKGWKVLARVVVKYNGLQLPCLLIRGYRKPSGIDPFFFLELPCHRFINNKGEWRKQNFCNFENQKDSDDFQEFGFRLVFENNISLFQEDLKEKNNQNKKEKKENDL